MKQELQHVQGSSPLPVTYTSLQPFRGVNEGKPIYSQSNFNRCASVSGKLEVRLMGCQDLLEDVPGRSRRDKDNNSSPVNFNSFVKGFPSRSSSKSYSVKDETSTEIMAVIKLDNTTVGQTSWKPCSQQAWDQRFSIDLDKSRELEIGIYWRDYRSLCAVKFLRLEEFIDVIQHGMALQMEPQGVLFAEIKFINPMISRKPKLQRQRMIFNKQHKNMPRAKQMNINVATWGRLLKMGRPQNQTPSTPISTHETMYTRGGANPQQLIFDQPDDPAETAGENPDVNVIGLGGQRPLGNADLVQITLYFYNSILTFLGLQGVTSIPDSPKLNAIESNDNFSSHPASFRNNKKPTTLSPSPSAGKMYQDVSDFNFMIFKFNSYIGLL